MSEIAKLTKDGDRFTCPDGMSWSGELDYLCIHHLGLCGCGNPEEVAGYVRERLALIRGQDYPSYEDLPAMFFLYWADDKGLAEHGSTVRCAWLTEKGESVLRDLENLLAKGQSDD